MILDTKEINEKLLISSNQPKKFVFDLDGTIIYEGKPLDKTFEKILLEIKAAGHEVIFATGRSWRDFIPVLPKWCSEQPSVVFGGGLAIYQGQVKYQHFLNQQVVIEVVDFLEKQKVPYLVDGHSDYYHPPGEHWLYSDIVALTGQHRAASIDNIIVDGVYKILILDEKLLDYYKDYINNKQLVIKYHFYDKCFDIMPSEVNKYNGLCQLTSFDSNNVFVFGNDHNDLELMQELPNSIMFGHHSELKKYAKLQIEYDNDLLTNFSTIVKTILKK